MSPDLPPARHTHGTAELLSKWMNRELKRTHSDSWGKRLDVNAAKPITPTQTDRTVATLGIESLDDICWEHSQATLTLLRGGTMVTKIGATRSTWSVV